MLAPFWYLSEFELNNVTIFSTVKYFSQNLYSDPVVTVTGGSGLGLSPTFPFLYQSPGPKATEDLCQKYEACAQPKPTKIRPDPPLVRYSADRSNHIGVMSFMYVWVMAIFYFASVLHNVKPIKFWEDFYQGLCDGLSETSLIQSN
jgi:hypothetical protein